MFTRCGERVGAPSPPSPCDLHTRREKGRGGAYIMAPLVAVDHDWTNVHYWPPLSTLPRRHAATQLSRPSPLASHRQIKNRRKRDGARRKQQAEKKEPHSRSMACRDERLLSISVIYFGDPGAATRYDCV